MPNVRDKTDRQYFQQRAGSCLLDSEYKCSPPLHWRRYQLDIEYRSFDQLMRYSLQDRCHSDSSLLDSLFRSGIAYSLLRQSSMTQQHILDRQTSPRLTPTQPDMVNKVHLETKKYSTLVSSSVAGA